MRAAKVPNQNAKARAWRGGIAASLSEPANVAVEDMDANCTEVRAKFNRENLL